MNTQQANAVADCARRSAANEIEFPEVVRRLLEVGVERYHADYCRQEITYYWPTGETHVVPMWEDAGQVGQNFDAAAIQAAIRQSQRSEHTYHEFVHKTRAAGCVGYFVQLSGRCAIYFGREGDFHIERFPANQK